MPPVGFEPTISAGERPKTYALDRAATGFGIGFCYYIHWSQFITERFTWDVFCNFYAICFRNFVRLIGRVVGPLVA
jgi:hypothetical protein